MKSPSTLFDPDAWLTERVIASPLGDGSGGATLTIADIPGIFSEGRLDEGTAMLLRALQEQPVGPVLDFAAGAGVIAAATKKQWPAIEVTLVDVQWQALHAARRTLASNHQSGTVLGSHGLGALEGRFGTIITNPPFHTGIKTDLEIVRTFIHQARSHLLQGGVLWLVANAFLPYRELLEEAFSTVVIAAEDTRFRVYRAEAARVGSKSKRSSR